MSLKNYYSILALDFFESNQDAIKKAYQKATEVHHPNSYIGEDIKEQLTDINEAFLILSNKHSKQLYDQALSTTGIYDTGELDNLISTANTKSKTFVESYFNGTQKRKKKGCTAGAIFCAIFLFAVLGGVIKNCARAVSENKPAQATKIEKFVVPNSWTEYTIDNSFSLSIPPTLELRSDLDEYTKFISNKHLSLSNADAVFQQRDLSNMDKDALDTYCIVLAMRAYVGADEVEHYYESPQLQSSDYAELRDIADAEIEPWTYITTPTYEWIDINGIKGIDISYTRNGEKGPVICHIYLFFNYDELVKIVTAYRKIDEDKWKTQIGDIIKTFAWNHLK